MMGRSHMVSATAIAAAVWTSGVFASNVATEPGFASDMAVRVLHVFDTHMNMFTVTDGYDPKWKAAAIAACVLLYYFGALVPDIDHPDSMVSRMFHFHIPLVHKGVTHGAYIAIFLSVLAAHMRWYPVYYLAAGFLTHCIMDWFSTSGWVPFYPFGKHNVWHNTVIQKGRHLSLYRTGEKSEFIFVVALCGIALAFMFFTYAVYYI